MQREMLDASQPAYFIKDQKWVHFSPSPAGISWALDAFGNERAQLWFNGLHRNLTVRVEAVVDILAGNPFDYLLTSEWAVLPCMPDMDGPLAVYLRQRHPPPPAGDRLERALHPLVRANTGVPGFLTALNGHLFSTLEKVERTELGVLPPEEVLASGRGACRDTALLFIEACRRLAPWTGRRATCTPGPRRLCPAEGGGGSTPVMAWRRTCTWSWPWGPTRNIPCPWQAVFAAPPQPRTWTMPCA